MLKKHSPAGKVGFDAKLNEGETIGAPEDAGLAAADKPTSNCKVGAEADKLTCEIQNGPASVKDKVITLTRSTTDGSWACSADVEEALIGKGTWVAAAAPAAP